MLALVAKNTLNLVLFSGAPLHHQKLPKGVVHKNKYILRLPPEI